MKKFECTKCGNCCSRISGKDLNDEEKEFVEQTFFGMMPVIQLVPADTSLFALFDWEVKRLEEKAKELDIKINIVPLHSVFDTKRNQSIIMKYGLDHEKCPFLSDDSSCKIYKQRPFGCKEYPFQKGPFMDDDISTDEKTFTPSKLSDNCPGLRELNLEKIDKDAIKTLYESFGDSFLAAMQNDLINIWMNDVIISMMKKDIIKPLMQVDYNVAIEKINNNPKIPFTDFLVDSKMHPRPEMDMLIGIFEDYNDVKRKVNELLKK